jgi:hypothetical protein
MPLALGSSEPWSRIEIARSRYIIREITSVSKTGASCCWDAAPSAPVPPAACADRLFPICDRLYRSKGAILVLRLAEIWRKSGQ